MGIIAMLLQNGERTTHIMNDAFFVTRQKSPAVTEHCFEECKASSIKSRVWIGVIIQIAFLASVTIGQGYDFNLQRRQWRYGGDWVGYDVAESKVGYRRVIKWDFGRLYIQFRSQND